MKKSDSSPVVPSRAVPSMKSPSVSSGGKTIDYKGPKSTALPKMGTEKFSQTVREAKLTHPKCK